MIIRTDNHIRITTTNIKLIEKIKKDLTKRNPVYKSLERMGKPVDDVPQYIEMWHIDREERICIPRGTGRYIRDLSHKYKDNITNYIDDTIIHDEIDVKINFNDIFKDFYNYQKKLIKYLTSMPFGVGVAGCGAGKTVSAMGMIAKIKQRTLIVVHTKELLTQWLTEINDKLTGNFTIGQLGAGKKVLGDITIGLIQTLRNAKDNDWKKLNDYFGMIIIDEVHRVPANSYLRVLKSIKFKYIYGLSATPNRKDGLHFLLYNYIGPVRVEITDEELKAAKKLVSCKVKIIKTGYNVDFDKIGQNWIVYNRMLSRNMIRNKLIANEVEEDINNGLYPIILINRVQHGWALAEILRHKGFKVGVLMGAVDKEERKQVVDDARLRNLDVLISNEKIAGEGLDIKPLDTIHLVYPINNKGNIKQFVGRIRRTDKGKEFGYIRDYRDNIMETRGSVKVKSNMAIRMYSSRDATYRELGFEFEN